MNNLNYKVTEDSSSVTLWIFDDGSGNQFVESYSDIPGYFLWDLEILYRDNSAVNIGENELQSDIYKEFKKTPSRIIAEGNANGLTIYPQKLGPVGEECFANVLGKYRDKDGEISRKKIKITKIRRKK